MFTDTNVNKRSDFVNKSLALANCYSSVSVLIANRQKLKKKTTLPSPYLLNVQRVASLHPPPPGSSFNEIV